MKLPSYVCRKSQNTEAWTCICGNCKVEKLTAQLADALKRNAVLTEALESVRLTDYYQKRKVPTLDIKSIVDKALSGEPTQAGDSK